MNKKEFLLENPTTKHQMEYLLRYNLKINITNTKMRGLIALKDFNIGDTILINQCFSKILISKYISTRCYYCFKSLDKLLRCSRCKYVYYCIILF